MNNKRLKQLIMVLGFLIFISSPFIIKQEYVTKDEKKFKTEYEYFNNKVSLSFGKKYPSVHIEKQNGVSYVSSKEALKLMKSGTGILFLSYRESIGTRRMIEDFLKTSNRLGVEKIYYLDAYSIRDEKIANEDKVTTLKEGSKDYQKMIEFLGDKVPSYEGLKDESKRIYFPTILFLKKGKIMGSYFATKQFEESYNKISPKSKKEMISQIEENMKKVK